MRGVADQRQPLADEGARDEIAERKRARLVERLDLAEMQAKALLELAVKFILAERDDARRLGALLGPYQRGALSGQRQDRERAGGQEMLFGAAVMIALVADGDDDAGLIVVPAMGGDAGALAQLRARAVGGDQQARLDRRCRRPASHRRHRRASRSRSPRWRADRCPAASARATSASIRWRFSTMCANGSPGSTSPAKVRNTGRVASSSLESVTTMSRIGCAPAATWSQTPSASNSRRQAATMAVARGSRLGRAASAGSATMTGISAPRPWRSASASASPANAPPPMTMLRCADMPTLTRYVIRLYLLPDYSWAKQGRETRVSSLRSSFRGDARSIEPGNFEIPGSRSRAPRNDEQIRKRFHVQRPD